MIKSFSFLLMLSSLAVAQTSVVNIDALGAVSDGNTDNTQIIQNTVNHLKAGQQLFFSCSHGSLYKVTQPIQFGSLVDVSIKGAGEGCNIGYFGGAGTTYAFSFQGAERVAVSDIGFLTGNGSTPRVILLLARPAANSNGQSGQHKFHQVRVEGYASVAVTYSIASEENDWNDPTMILNGGGGKYVFYTSSTDDQNVSNSIPAGSNLSLWMRGAHLLDFAASQGDISHSLIYDVGNGSGTGDHVYRDGYGATAGTCYAVADLAPAWYYGPAWMSITFDNNRCESHKQMFYFDAPHQAGFANITISNNRSATGQNNSFFVNTSDRSTRIVDLHMVHNSIEQGDNSTSVLPDVFSSTIDNAFPVTVANLEKSSMLVDRSDTFGGAKMTIPALATGATHPVCANAAGQLVACP